MRHAVWLLLIVCGSVLAACTQGTTPTAEETSTLPPERTTTQTTVQYAQGFSVTYEAGYRVVDILTPWRDADATFRYVLVPRGTPPPADVAGAQVVETPVRSIVSLSMTYLAMMDRLGLANRVTGLSGTQWVNTPAIQERIDAGEILEIGAPNALNYEQVVALDPDVVMTYSMGHADADLRGKLDELGVQVVLNAEYMEPTPLGRAEWIKFVALFFDREAEAERLFAEIATRYEAMAAQARSVAEKPTVFLGADWRGSWFMAGGRSFTAHLLRDAGAHYLWADTETETVLQLDLETVFDRASQADIWLHPSTHATLESLHAADARYDEFSAWQTGQVYNNNRRVNPQGGNDFWESGVIEPDVVMADLIKIFHPTLLPDHTLYYYQQLTPQ